MSKKTVLLTGAAGILGTRITKRLVADGAFVIAVDRDAAALEGLADERSLTGSILTHEIDLTDRPALLALRDHLDEEQRPVEALVNAAAAKSTNFFAPFEEFPMEEWRELMDINVMSAMLCSQVFGPAMSERGDGTIINVLSVYGIVGPDQRIYEGSEYLGEKISSPAIYSASKAALWGLTLYLATYWGPRGVRANAVTPGGVFSGQNDIFVSQYSNRVPLGRMAEPEDIAAAVSYLVSDDARYVNGHNLVVDGGLTAW